jgi:hypothetical protein
MSITITLTHHEAAVVVSNIAFGARDLLNQAARAEAKDQPEVADALTGQAATCTEIIKRLADAMEAANAAAKQGAKA